MRILACILALLSFSIVGNAQQICLKNHCSDENKACNQDCQKLLSDCTFSCTLLSQGCMQDCVSANQSAKVLLDCSYEKCLNY